MFQACFSRASLRLYAFVQFPCLIVLSTTTTTTTRVLMRLISVTVVKSKSTAHRNRQSSFRRSRSFPSCHFLSYFATFRLFAVDDEFPFSFSLPFALFFFFVLVTSNIRGIKGQHQTGCRYSNGCLEIFEVRRVDKRKLLTRMEASFSQLHEDDVCVVACNFLERVKF